MTAAPSTVSSSVFSSSSNGIDWAQSWANAADSWKNDPQGLLTTQKLYEEELKQRNSSYGFLSPFRLPYLSNVMPTASPYVVGLYRSSMLEMIHRDPALMNEFLSRIGGPMVLSQTALYAHNNPAIAYGASSDSEVGNARRRKDLIFADLSMWVKELAARQNYRAPLFKNNPVLGGQVSSTSMTMVPLLVILLLILGGIWYFKK